MTSDPAPEVYPRLLHLSARYALGVDTGDSALVAECFAPESELRIADALVESGGEKIAARLTSRSTLGVLHTSTGLVARPRDDGAWDLSSYFFMFDTRIGQLTAAGRYDDVVVDDADGTRYRSRDVHYQWRAGSTG